MNGWMVYQSIKQLLGLVYIPLRYGKRFPDASDYAGKARYVLPFEGAWTVVNGGATREFSHSWDVPTQRYAYDFIMVDDGGHSYSGDLTSPESYYCYGLNILAPGDGVVVHAVDGCGDSVIDKAGNAHCNARDICGNHIIIRHAEDEYSFLAHLMKDSVLVKRGDRVTQGQRIARCGNSGNSSQPHLHFHLQNKKSFYMSLGLPVEFNGVNACMKKNYGLFDPRQVQDGCMELGGRRYIGRGQEVSNGY